MVPALLIFSFVTCRKHGWETMFPESLTGHSNSVTLIVTFVFYIDWARSKWLTLLRIPRLELCRCNNIWRVNPNNHGFCSIQVWNIYYLISCILYFGSESNTPFTSTVFLLYIPQEDEDKEEEINSGSECGDDVEVDVCAIERIPALCSRYMFTLIRCLSSTLSFRGPYREWRQLLIVH
jgi:hypothetical protein